MWLTRMSACMRRWAWSVALWVLGVLARLKETALYGVYTCLYRRPAALFACFLIMLAEIEALKDEQPFAYKSLLRVLGFPSFTTANIAAAVRLADVVGATAPPHPAVTRAASNGESSGGAGVEARAREVEEAAAAAEMRMFDEIDSVCDVLNGLRAGRFNLNMYLMPYTRRTRTLLLPTVRLHPECALVVVGAIVRHNTHFPLPPHFNEDNCPATASVHFDATTGTNVLQVVEQIMACEWYSRAQFARVDACSAGGPRPQYRPQVILVAAQKTPGAECCLVLDVGGGAAAARTEALQQQQDNARPITRASLRSSAPGALPPIWLDKNVISFALTLDRHGLWLVTGKDADGYELNTTTLRECCVAFTSPPWI